jgi:hypothetical protein
LFIAEPIGFSGSITFEDPQKSGSLKPIAASATTTLVRSLTFYQAPGESLVSKRRRNADFVVSVMDVLDLRDPEQIMRLELPFVMDLVKAKIRLEESKAKAQKNAQEMERLQQLKR